MQSIISTANESTSHKHSEKLKVKFDLVWNHFHDELGEDLMFGYLINYYNLENKPDYITDAFNCALGLEEELSVMYYFFLEKYINNSLTLSNYKESFLPKVHFDNTSFCEGFETFTDNNNVSEIPGLLDNDNEVFAEVVSKLFPKKVWSIVDSCRIDGYEIKAGFRPHEAEMYFISQEDWCESSESYVWFNRYDHPYITKTVTDKIHFLDNLKLASSKRDYNDNPSLFNGYIKKNKYSLTICNESDEKVGIITNTGILASAIKMKNKKWLYSHSAMEKIGHIKVSSDDYIKHSNEIDAILAYFSINHV